MSKLSCQIHNTRFDFKFDNREQVDALVTYLRSHDGSFLGNLEKIADALDKEKDQVDSVQDFNLIPEIIEAINVHVKNAGDLTKFGSKLTGWVATELVYNKETDKWTTDNGYIIDIPLKRFLQWLRESAPEFWGRK